jgi:Aromatic-ring hydroxylase, C-terminal
MTPESEGAVTKPASPALVVLYRALSSINGVLEHANLRLRPTLGTALSCVWVTPNMRGAMSVVRISRQLSEWTGYALSDVGPSLPRTEVVGLGQLNNDVLGAWWRMREIADDGCLLVRPDRIIAWRSPHGASDPAGALRATVTAILGR